MKKTGGKKDHEKKRFSKDAAAIVHVYDDLRM